MTIFVFHLVDTQTQNDVRRTFCRITSLKEVNVVVNLILSIMMYVLITQFHQRSPHNI